MCANGIPKRSSREGGLTREAKKIRMGCEVRHECLRRPGSRRAVRHLGRSFRTRAPPPQTCGIILTRPPESAARTRPSIVGR